MGHTVRLKEEHRALVRRLEAGTAALPEPDSEVAQRARREILELLFTAEEAAIASRLPVLPASLKRVAAQVGLPEHELEPKLAAMCDKGLVMDLVNPRTGKTRYFLSPPVIGFFEFSLMRANDPRVPQRELARAMSDYFHGDPAFAREVFDRPTVVGRALVHETALDEDDLPDVLDWEKATAILSSARSLAVSLCYCRHEAEHLGRRCPAPMEACLSVDAGADFVVRHQFGRAIERAEALEILSRSREQGLVQIGDNVQSRPSYVCNCCGCCCGQLQAISEYGLRAVNPSGFLASSDGNRCAGCSRCARACPIGAIEMTQLRVPGRIRSDLRPKVDGERCIGCGVCAGACNKGAMTMSRRQRQPLVPANTVEKAVRMALDRGKLAHLVFDEGSGRGAKFLNRVLSALMALPPARQAFASEQLKSRFVRFALSQVKDPTA